MTTTDFFFGRMQAAAFVPLRVALGVSFFAYYAFAYHSFGIMFTDQGLAGVLYPEHANWFSGDVAKIVWSAGLVSLACFTLGFRTRTAGFLFLLLNVYLSVGADVGGWGWHRIAKPLFLIVLFGNPGATFSVDSWLASRRGRPLDATASRLILRLIQLHVSCIYLAASLHRVNDPYWLSGDMVFFALDFSLYSRFPYVDLHVLRPWLRPLCWGALGIELLGIAGPWLRRYRELVLWLLIAMHLSLELLTTTGRWQLILVGALLTVLFGTKDQGYDFTEFFCRLRKSAVLPNT